VRTLTSATLLAFGLSLSVTAPLAAAPNDKPAKTEDPAAMARRYFNAGQKAFSEGRFVESAKAFLEAYRLKPHPAPLINAGDAWERAGESAQAARAYQRVLELEDASEQDRADAVERLAQLGPKLGILELIGDPSQRVRVDDEEFKGGSRVYVFPGEHRVTLLDVEGAKLRRLEIAAGTSRSIDLQTLEPGKSGTSDTTTPTTIEPVPDSVPTEGGIRPLTWAAFGLAAVGVAGAVYFGLQVNDAEASYNDDPNQDDYDRFNQNKLLTNVSIGVAGVGAALGTVLLIVDVKRGKKNPPEPLGRAPIDVVPTQGGALLSASGRF
jgi:tetratricopeptide (TPR) repeat protein